MEKIWLSPIGTVRSPVREIVDDVWGGLASRVELDANRFTVLLADTSLLIFGLGVHGMFVNAVQSTMYALCAYVYPTSVRATGTASALAFRSQSIFMIAIPRARPTGAVRVSVL